MWQLLAEQANKIIPILKQHCMPDGAFVMWSCPEILSELLSRFKFNFPHWNYTEIYCGNKISEIYFHPLYLLSVWLSINWHRYDRNILIYTLYPSRISYWQSNACLYGTKFYYTISVLNWKVTNSANTFNSFPLSRKWYVILVHYFV